MPWPVTLQLTMCQYLHRILGTQISMRQEIDERLLQLGFRPIPSQSVHFIVASDPVLSLTRSNGDVRA
jgi:hypothetical protein